MSRERRVVSDEARSHRTEIRLTDAAVLVGTVALWAIVAAAVGRAFRLW